MLTALKAKATLNYKKCKGKKSSECIYSRLFAPLFPPAFLLSSFLGYYWGWDWASLRENLSQLGPWHQTLAFLWQARLLSVRTRGCSGEMLQDVRVEEAPRHPAAPAPCAGAVDRWLHIGAKIKPGFLQMHGVPRRAPPRQLLAQVVQIEQGGRNELSIWLHHQMFLPCSTWAGSESRGQTARRTPRVRDECSFPSLLPVLLGYGPGSQLHFMGTWNSLKGKMCVQCNRQIGEGVSALGMGWGGEFGFAEAGKSLAFGFLEEWAPSKIYFFLREIRLPVIVWSLRLETGSLTLCVIPDTQLSSCHCLVFLLQKCLDKILQQFSRQIW